MNLRFPICYCFALLLIVSLVGCSKEYSRESPDPVNTPATPQQGQAVFTLVKQNSSCSDAKVEGTYKVGTPLGSDAKIQVSVQVTTPGFWTMSTGMVNGMSYTASGTFTTVGKQTITLTGTGSPEKDGAFFFPLQTNGSSCSVIVVINGDVQAPTADFYYRMTVNGKQYVQEVTEDNGFLPTTGILGTSDVFMTTGVVWPGATLPKGKTSLQLTMGILRGFDAMTDADFKNFFKPGNYNYLVLKNGQFTDGVQLNWTDENGVEWETLNGSTAGQPDATFSIVSTDVWDGNYPFYGIKIKVRFTCKFYNPRTGDALNITDGEMTGIFLKKR
ncbi:hypothetical protein [Chitinophaga qingshengii]|uniref:Uncharacterized protein n=1 Tax=Chitinophaga qingshengii TaxID=1569794 RepID=A0ABR7TH74_9BACT|nr:hypothetical protein [Chitinophaga qingshengii]MBC9928873.1 hypothetical protein [Chitinophaga qingshengii]